MIKSFCMFCGKPHKSSKPKLCTAKGKVLRGYLEQVPARDAWKVFHGIKTGLLPFTEDAMRLVQDSRKAARKTSKSA